MVKLVFWLGSYGVDFCYLCLLWIVVGYEWLGVGWILVNFGVNLIVFWYSYVWWFGLIWLFVGVVYLFWGKSLVCCYIVGSFGDCVILIVIVGSLIFWLMIIVCLD